MPAPALPVLSLPEVFHVGSMDAADKGCRGPSYEGHGLSVSLHPDAWIHIARLGGHPTWTLTCGTGAFLDVHALDDVTRTTILDWGVRSGWLERVVVFDVSWFDDELDTDVYSSFLSREDAAAEADALEVEEVTSRDTVAATELLAARTGTSDLASAPDMAVVVFVTDMTGLDGAWWNDTLSPETLSAPRGVIVPERLRRWAAVRSHG